MSPNPRPQVGGHVVCVSGQFKASSGKLAARAKPSRFHEPAVRLYLPLLLLLIAAYAYRPWEGGDDFWAHAAIGRWALEHRQVPHHTLFLWSDFKAEHVFHAWLSGVVFALPLLAGGTSGGPWLALGLNIVAAMFPFALLWTWARRRGELSGFVALLMVLAIWTASVRWHLRPELFTVAFLTLLYLFFTSESRPLWKCALVVLMFGWWPNFHGGVLVGLVILWLTTLADSAQFRTKVPPRFAFAFACTSAVFIGSPYHLNYYVTWLDINGAMFSNIAEWKPFWEAPKLNIEVVVGLGFLWGMALYTWILSPQKRWAQLGWLLFMGVSFLQARRQLWLCSATVSAVILLNAQVWTTEAVYERWRTLRRGAGLEPTPPAALRRLARSGVLGILGLSIVVALPTDDLGRAVSSRFPTGMAQYLLAHPNGGKVLNDYEYSAALEWLLHDKRPLYIDLINAYKPKIFFDYLAMRDLIPRAEGIALLQKSGASVVALRSSDEDEKPIPLGAYLDKQPDWKRVYKGRDGAIWEKREAK